MFNPAKFLDDLLHFDPQQRRDEAYLAQATDLSDLERRMLDLETESHRHIPDTWSTSGGLGGHAGAR